MANPISPICILWDQRQNGEIHMAFRKYIIYDKLPIYNPQFENICRIVPFVVRDIVFSIDIILHYLINDRVGVKERQCRVLFRVEQGLALSGPMVAPDPLALTVSAEGGQQMAGRGECIDSTRSWMCTDFGTGMAPPPVVNCEQRVLLHVFFYLFLYLFNKT